MKPFQFRCSNEVDGQHIPVSELTPVVTCYTVTEAMNHPDIVTWCNDHGYRIFKVVGK